MNLFKKLALAATVAASALLGTAAPAFAAEFAAEENGDSTIVVMSGKIEFGDHLKFKRIGDRIRTKKVFFVLESGGGNVYSALMIGYMISGDTSREWTTFVGEDGVCASACADIWLAGDVRGAHKTARIGMHSEGYAVALKGGKTKTVRGPNTERIAYFLHLGYGKDAIVKMLTPNPDDMFWLTPAWGKALGITYVVVG